LSDRPARHLCGCCACKWHFHACVFVETRGKLRGCVPPCQSATMHSHADHSLMNVLSASRKLCPGSTEQRCLMQTALIHLGATHPILGCAQVCSTAQVNQAQSSQNKTSPRLHVTCMRTVACCGRNVRDVTASTRVAIDRGTMRCTMGPRCCSACTRTVWPPLRHRKPSLLCFDANSDTGSCPALASAHTMGKRK